MSSVSLSRAAHVDRWQVTPCLGLSCCSDSRVWSAQAFSGWGGLGSGWCEEGLSWIPFTPGPFSIPVRSGQDWLAKGLSSEAASGWL